MGLLLEELPMANTMRQRGTQTVMFSKTGHSKKCMRPTIRNTVLRVTRILFCMLRFKVHVTLSKEAKN